MELAIAEQIGEGGEGDDDEVIDHARTAGSDDDDDDEDMLPFSGTPDSAPGQPVVPSDAAPPQPPGNSRGDRRAGWPATGDSGCRITYAASNVKLRFWVTVKGGRG